jgi:hypothetical protein
MGEKKLKCFRWLIAIQDSSFRRRVGLHIFVT